MAALNLNNFTPVINDDFTRDKSLDTSIWTDHWGNPNQYWFTGTGAGLLISGSQSANWNPVGIEQAPTGKSAGEGYGLYSFTGYAGQAGQGVGICFVLWPSDNVWLPSNKPGQASEIDILESWDGTKNGYSTIHFYDSAASGNNGQSIHQIRIDPTVSHTYSMDWERGSLTYYVDGQELYQDTAHVPLDAADGGVNETLGAEVVNEASYHTTPTVQFYIQDISYSRPNTGGGAPPPPVQPPAPAPTCVLAALGTVQEASPGAGVTITETVSGTNLTTLYAEVLTASGAVESGWQTITLNASGKGSFSAHLAHSGDIIQAVDNAAKPTLTSKSTAIIITDPVVAIPPGTGGNLLGQSAAGPLSFAVLTAANNGKAVIELDVIKSVGRAATLREYIDNRYMGALRDHLADGSYAIDTPALANGAHTIKLTLDGSTSVATASFTVPGGQPSPLPPTNPGGGPVSTPPGSGGGLLGQSPSGPLSFRAMATAAGLDLDVAKTIGKAATLREFIDNTYVGALRDHLTDGIYTIATPTLAAGMHTIKLTLDGSAATATASFRISAAGVQAAQIAGFADSAQLHAIPTAPAASGAAPPALPDLASGSGTQLLAALTGASLAPAILLHGHSHPA